MSDETHMTHDAMMRDPRTDYALSGSAYQRLARENARLRRVLEFYASESNHERREQFSGDYVLGKPSLMEYDKGARARQALKGGDNE